MEKKKEIIFIVIACISIIIFSIAICPIQLQNDTFYTIKIGEYIMENGVSVVTNGIDPFSWHDNLPYTFPHWAYDIIIYSIFNLWGFLGIHISTIIFTSILGLSIFFVNSKLTKNKLISFIITIGALYLIKNYIAARAQLITFILFIWTIYFIEKYLQTRQKRYAVFLIATSIIIANVHSAVWPFFFVLFLPYIAEYILSSGENIRKWRMNKLHRKLQSTDINESNKQKIQAKIIKLENRIKHSEERREKGQYKIILERNRNVKGLVIILIICAFTGLLTPIGDAPYTYLIKTMQGNTTKNISEHLPLTLANFHEFACFLILFLGVLIFRDSKIKLRDLFMMSGLLFLAFMSRRQISMFVLIGSVIFNRIICMLINKYDPNGSKKVLKHMTSIPGVIITIALMLIISLCIIKPKMHDKFINEKNYPVLASDYILENVDISNMRIYNYYNYGSYLIFRGIPVFIDSRADLYTPEFNNGKDIFSDLVNISAISVYYEDKFKEYDITHVLVSKRSKLNMLILRDNHYNLLYNDDNFCFYQRLTGDN